MKKSYCLIVFAKAPIPGQVKTRLARQMGFVNAARIYRQLLSCLTQSFTKLKNCHIEMHCSPDTHHPFLRQCAKQLDARLYRQKGSDLGERMYHAIRSALSRTDICVLIGSDMPEIGVNDINDSIDYLKRGSDVVFLPANDGGYGLVAMKANHIALFRNMRWSQSDVMEKTLLRAQRLDLICHLLGAKTDIDTKQDHISYRRRQ